MKKIVAIIVVCIITIAVICFYNYNQKQKSVNANSDAVVLEKEVDGMKVTMFGGTNMPDKGASQCMGYYIRTKNGKNIIVDGGYSSDYELVKSYIDKYGNGKVDHWILTHGHRDHVGAFNEVITKENTIEIENLYYSFLEDEWYKENDARGYDSEHLTLQNLSSSKIKNHVECTEGKKINIDNIELEIIRIPNPEITNGDNGNEASMVFKLTATDVNKSMIFLGDAMSKASVELLRDHKEQLKSDAVQMAHHGNWGVTEEVYKAINPEVAFFNAPKGLYDNDEGNGYNTGKFSSVQVRGWLEKIGVKTNFVAFEGDQTVHFNSEGITKIEEN